MHGREQIIEQLNSGVDLRSIVKGSFRSLKIKIGQLDPNGLCNAGCWFCPVKYQGNPTEFVNQMSPDELEQIVIKIKTSSVVDPTFNFVYTAHYNEILLYRYFEEMLQTFRKHGLTTMVLSNGTTLTPKHTDIIIRYLDVVRGVHLNIPSFERDDWAKKTNLNPGLFDNLVRNLDYFYARSTLRMSVQINCATENSSFLGDGGILTRSGEAVRIKAKFNSRYQDVNATVSEYLIDRAGELGKGDVIRGPGTTSRPVIGCNHSFDAHNSGRVYGWIHVNAVGDLFLCCNDYKMEYRFGNLLTDNLDDLWLSDRHVDVTLQAFEGICKDCSFRVTK